MQFTEAMEHILLLLNYDVWTHFYGSCFQNLVKAMQLICICKSSIYLVLETQLSLSKDLVNKWTHLEMLLLKDPKCYLKKN